MKTVGKKLLISVKNEKEKKHGSLILVTEQESPTSTGLVLAVGPEAKTVKEGDTVVFERMTGVEIVKTDELSTVCLSEDNVLAVV